MATVKSHRQLLGIKVLHMHTYSEMSSDTSLIIFFKLNRVRISGLQRNTPVEGSPASVLIGPLSLLMSEYMAYAEICYYSFYEISLKTSCAFCTKVLALILSL